MHSGYALCILHHYAYRMAEPMDARAYWAHYVDSHGGIPQTAEALGIPYSTIAGICNGSRGIGRALARRLAQADPMLDERKLVWVTATKPRPEEKRVA